MNHIVIDPSGAASYKKDPTQGLPRVLETAYLPCSSSYMQCVTSAVSRSANSQMEGKKEVFLCSRFKKNKKNGLWACTNHFKLEL